MKINPNYCVKKFAGETVLVHQNKNSVDFTKIITLNEMGEFIYSHIAQGMTQPEIVKAIMEEYEADEKTVTEDVKEFVQKLVDHQIVNE